MQPMIQAGRTVVLTLISVLPIFATCAGRFESVGLPATANSGVAPIELQQIYHDAAIFKIDETIDGSKLKDRGDGVFWERSFTKSDTRYVRFYFDNIKAQSKDFRIRVLRDPAATMVAEYSGTEFANRPDFITGLLPSGELRIQLMSSRGLADLSFELVQASWREEPNRAIVESFAPRWTYITSLRPDHPAIKAARAVAMVHIGPSEVKCTGALIEPELVVTNYHCMRYSLAFLQSGAAIPHQCTDVVVEFDYLVKDAPGRQARCLAVRVNRDLDVAFLSIDAAAVRIDGQERIPLLRRPDQDGLPTTIAFIHHPVGLPLVLDDNCHLRGRTDPLTEQHDCITTQGSSGSPIVDKQWRWVAIHFEAAYPSKWTFDQIMKDLADNGEKYNKARPAPVVAAAEDGVQP
jgi:hypothetical protein